MPGNHNTAASGFLLFVNSVFDAETSSFYSIVKDSRVFVVANTAEIDDGVVREDVLGAASCVLCSTSSDELCRVVVKEVLVDAQMLFFGKDGIIGLEAILRKKCFVTKGLDIWDRRVRLRLQIGIPLIFSFPALL